MSQSFEHAKSRLDNIKAIEPLLSALRTMSMGAWQMANNKIANMEKFETNYDLVLFEILPHIHQIKTQKQKSIKMPPSIADTIVLIVGSERGLCGKFNTTLAENALAFIDQAQFPSHQIWAMGSRLMLELKRMDAHISWQKKLPASNLTSYRDAYFLTQNWLDQYETFAFNQLIILYNQMVKGTTHQFSSFNLLPFEINYRLNSNQKSEERWPPPIIETDPIGIYKQIIQHFIASSLYKVLLKSAAAEHSARYHLMQEASENAEEIIEELVRVLNAERKRKITQEMQEIAVSAGLLDHN
jgi:F-type H+-transporting ATPase subunit gamma